MKTVMTFLLAGALLAACGSDENGAGNSNQNAQGAGAADGAAATNTDTGGTPGAAGDMVANERGLELIGASDCTACHAIDKKLIGPAYTEVAKRYANNPGIVDSLVGKIKNGGMGNWGTVPMTPHPDLPDADAREMVKYILSLKNQ